MPRKEGQVWTESYVLEMGRHSDVPDQAARSKRNKDKPRRKLQRRKSDQNNRSRYPRYISGIARRSNTPFCSLVLQLLKSKLGAIYSLKYALSNRDIEFGIWPFKRPIINQKGRQDPSCLLFGLRRVETDIAPAVFVGFRVREIKYSPM